MPWYEPWTWGDESQSQIDQRGQLIGQGDAASQFAGTGQLNYSSLTGRGNSALDYLSAQAAGQNSVSAEQLRQALQQNLAAQQSMAASASPANAAMAARTAAIQSARLGAGLAGQQSLAGLQERQQAQQAYAALLSQMRQQDLQAALGGRQAAIGAYGGYKPEGSFLDKWGNAITGGLGALTGSGKKDSGQGSSATAVPLGGLPLMAASDRRLKTDIKDGDAEANAAAAKLPRAWVFKYKDKRFGEGRQLGTMAQDLERAGLGHTVMDTPGGKVVHGAKLATANTAMLAAMSRRLERLEGKG